MSLVVPNVGKEYVLSNLTGGPGITCHLYQNNVTPSRTDVLGTFTEATYTGYASQALVGWSATAIDASNYAYSIATTLLFTVGVVGIGNLIYGYYLTDSGDLIGAEIFATGTVAMNVTGNAFTLTIELDCGSIYLN